MNSTDEALEDRIKQLGPWVGAFEYKGKIFGGSFMGSYAKNQQYPRGSKIDLFFQSFPNAKRILEIGTLEGLDTFQLAQQNDVTIVTIEGRKKNLEKAIFLSELYGFNNIEFLHANIEYLDLNLLGKFDAVVCCGILYHLTKPWTIIENISTITNSLFIWSHYWGSLNDTTFINGYRAKKVITAFPVPDMNALDEYSYWLTFDALRGVLLNNGFTRIRIFNNNCTKENSIGEITLAATH